MNKKTAPKIEFRLHEILAEKKRGGRDLARATGLGVATVSRIVNNHTHGVTLDVLTKICFELGVLPGELFRTIQKK